MHWSNNDVVKWTVGPTRCFRETGVKISISFGRPSMDVGQTACLHHLLLSRFFGLALQPSTLRLLLSNLIRRRLTAMKARISLDCWTRPVTLPGQEKLGTSQRLEQIPEGMAIEWVKGKWGIRILIEGPESEQEEAIEKGVAVHCDISEKNTSRVIYQRPIFDLNPSAVITGIWTGAWSRCVEQGIEYTRIYSSIQTSTDCHMVYTSYSCQHYIVHSKEIPRYLRTQCLNSEKGGNRAQVSFGKWT